MMNLKKLVCVTIAVSLLTLTFTACSKNEPANNGGDTPAAQSGGSSEPAPAANNPAPEPAANEPAPAEGKIRMSLGIYPADTDEALLAAHRAFDAAFAIARPDVEIVPAYYEYAVDTFVPMAEAGSVPTIFQSWFTEPQKLISNGYVRDITDILAARGWLNEMNPSIRELLSDSNGRVYGIPRDGYALGLMLNAELFQEAGLMNGDVPKYPKTWTELAETAKAIKDATGQAGLCLLAKDNAGGWHWSTIAWAYGATLVKDNGDGTFTANLDSPEAIAAMEFTKSLKWDYDVLTADPTSEDWGTGFTQLGTGGAAMYIGANDAVAQPTSNNGLPVNELALVPLPAGPGGQYSLYGGTPYFFAANATDDEVNAALDYLIVMGRSPEVTEDAKKGMEEDAIARKEGGTPVIPRFPCWTSEELKAADNEVNAKYGNVNMAMFNDYYAATEKPGNLRKEEPGDTQAMYAELTKVLQESLTNKNADVPALMKTANANLQKILVDAGIGK